jgi:hypothetical protein
MTRKLAALALAGVFCMSGTALASDPGYYLQISTGLAPLAGGQVCSQVGCNLEGVAQFITVHVSVIVDCHKGEGHTGAFYGLSESSGGTLAIHTGANPAPGFLAAPGAPPASSGFASTAGCQDCCTVIGSHSYLIVAPAPVVWSIGPNAELASMIVLDCNSAEVLARCGGQAAINSGGTAVCQCNGPTGVQDTSWGSLKALYE